MRGIEKTAIYQHSWEYAIQNGELDAYRESREANALCGQAIDKAVLDSSYELFHYDLKAAAKTVTEQFGFDRVNWLLAGCIQRSFNDGRYSRDNHVWASTFPIPDDRHGGFYLNSHPAILDGFVDAVRKTHAHMMTQDVGRHEQSRHMSEKNRLTVFDSSAGSFALRKGVTRERLAERHGALMEKKEARRASALGRLAAAKREVKPHAPKTPGTRKDMGLE